MTTMAGLNPRHLLWQVDGKMQTADFERACRAFVARRTPVFEGA